MAIANYPDGINTAGPTIARLITYPVEYPFDLFRNEDGGVDVNVQTCGVLRWELEYEGLSLSDEDTIRAHYNLAKGKVETFSFYSRYDSTLYTGVRYDSMQIPRHLRHWAKMLKVVLVKYA